MPLFFVVNATRSKEYNSQHALGPITYSRHAASEKKNTISSVLKSAVPRFLTSVSFTVVLISTKHTLSEND